MDCKHFGACGSCTIYGLEYSEELRRKRERVSSLFGIDDIEIFPSTQTHYRARAEFRVWHSKNGKIDYAMGNSTRDGVILIEECPKVSKDINSKMWVLRDMIQASPILRERLFSIEFLSVSNGEILVTMIYHKRLDDSWEIESRELEKKLDISIIGRSRKQKITLSRDFLTQRLTIKGREYIYRYYELGLPNKSRDKYQDGRVGYR